MRILVLLASSVVLAAIGFVVYWTMQSPDGRQTVTAHTAKHPVTLPTSGEGFGPGEHVWWNRYDAKGERTSRIRVSRYKPLKDGRFFVNDPECDFFLSNGQMLHIEGKTGNIVTQENISKNRSSPAASGGQNRSPRSGDLKGRSAFKPKTSKTKPAAEFPAIAFPSRPAAMMIIPISTAWDCACNTTTSIAVSNI